MDKKLYRSSKNKVISGVCGGLGEYFDVDPVIVRVIFFISLFVLNVISLITYIVLWIVLPVANGDQNKAKPKKDEKIQKLINSRSVTLIFAALLILAGFLFLFPKILFQFSTIGQLLTALVLIVVAIKIFYDVIKLKDYSLVRISIGFILLSFGLFLILNKFSFINSGIYWEYLKNLFPAILILLGVSIIFRTTKNRFLPALICAGVYIFIGVYSYVNGNYVPFGLMGRMMERMNLPSVGRWSQNYGNINGQDFSDVYAMPPAVERLSYTIENAGGSLKIGSADILLDYYGTGILPDIKTNWAKKVMEVQFDNHAADTSLKLGSGVLSDIALRVSAGNLEADFTDMNLRNLRLLVNGGAASVDIGENAGRLHFENNLGSTQVQLPKKANIRIRIETSMAHMDVPREFKKVNGEYVYGGGGKEIDITASVKMGNIEFKF